MTHAKTHSPGFLAMVDDAKTRIRELTIDEYTSMVAEGTRHVLVDVREDNEWAAGHAAGAMHLGKGVLERDVEAAIPHKGERLVLYCGGGYRSALAADALQKMGYTEVLSLDGGWRAIVSSGLPLEQSAAALP